MKQALDWPSRRKFCFYTAMRYRLLLCTLWIATAPSTYAATTKLEFLTVGSMTYSNITVLGFNASDLYFTSDHGIRNVKLKLLSPDMQQKFNYDPAAAEQAEQQQAEDEKRYHENLAAQMASEYNAARDARDAKAQALYAEAGLADAATSDSLIGKPAPALDMPVWVGTKPFMDGKFVLINIWSPNSASCKKWIPALNDLYRNLAGDKISVVGVTPAPPADVAQTDPKVDFPCAIDSSATFITAVNVTTFPCVILLDPTHAIRYEGHPAALTADMLQKVLNAGQAAQQ